MSMWRDAKEEARRKEDRWWGDGYKAGVIDGYEKGKADAVPVVRCGECKYYGEMLPGSDKRMICYKFMLNFDNDFFCRDGERKDDGAKVDMEEG